MKKFLFLVILSLTLFSCEGPMGPQGPQGVPGEGMFWKYYTYTVKSQDWQLVTSPDGLNTYYMYEFQNKDITDDLYIDGYIFRRTAWKFYFCSRFGQWMQRRDITPAHQNAQPLWQL